MDFPKALLDHKPERIVLTGYRCAMAGYDHGDAACWDDLWRHLVEDAGLAFACDAMGSLQYFVRSLRSATCAGASYYPQACQRLCRRECLVLALLSAQQRREAKPAAYALQHLFPEDEAAHVEQAIQSATAFALCLTQAQLHLMAVPMPVIRSIVESGTCQGHCPKLAH